MAKQITVKSREVNLEHGAEFTLIPDFTVGDGRRVIIESPNKYAAGYSIKVRGNKYAHDVRTINGVTDLVRPSKLEAQMNLSVVASLPTEITAEEFAFLGDLKAALDVEYAEKEAARKLSKAAAAKAQIEAQAEKLVGMDNVEIHD